MYTLLLCRKKESHKDLEKEKKEKEIVEIIRQSSSESLISFSLSFYFGQSLEGNIEIPKFVFLSHTHTHSLLFVKTLILFIYLFSDSDSS